MELIDCVRYDNLEMFLADRAFHYNEAAWFEPPVLYGLKFREPKVLPFQKYPGWFRFFKVEEAELVA